LAAFFTIGRERNATTTGDSIGFGYWLDLPAMAQQSTHRYAQFFKYSDQAMKAMTENPQDRAAQAAKLVESFGGKVENIHWFPMGGEYDGMIVWQLPDDATVGALNMMTRASGSFARQQSLPLMTSDEFKAAMEKAKGVKTNWTPPTATKQ
jgi:uncharacterized protein with GYD domain